MSNDAPIVRTTKRSVCVDASKELGSPPLRRFRGGGGGGGDVCGGGEGDKAEKNKVASH